MLIRDGSSSGGGDGSTPSERGDGIKARCFNVDEDGHCNDDSSLDGPQNHIYEGVRSESTPSSVPIFLKWLMPKSAYAIDVGGGLVSAKDTIREYASELVDRLARAPDSVKTTIVMGLAVIASKSAKKWEETADEFKRRGERYQELADELAAEIETKQKQTSGTCNDGTSCDAGNPCKDGSACTPTDNGGAGDGGGLGGGGGLADEGGSETEGKGPSANARSKIAGNTQRRGLGTPQGNTKGQHCATGAPGNTVVSRNCDCRKNNSCAKTRLPKISFSSLGRNIPPAYGQSYDALRNGGDALYRGDDVVADQHFDTLNRNAAALSKFNDNLFNNLKKKASRGGAAFPNQDLINKRFSDNVAGLYRGLSSSDMGAFASAAGLGLGGGSFGDDFGQGLEGQGAIRSPAVIKSFSGGGSGGMGMSPLDDMEFPPLEEVPPLASVPPPVDEIGNYKDNQSDIVAKPQISLWRILSNRYMTSGFPLVLEKKK